MIDTRSRLCPDPRTFKKVYVYVLNYISATLLDMDSDHLDYGCPSKAKSFEDLNRIFPGVATISQECFCPALLLYFEILT